MIVNKHISFIAESAPELKDYLDDHDIPYQSLHSMIVVDLTDSDAHWDPIARIVNERHLPCLSETEYSEEEKSGADWLSVRSKWRNGYPQPESAFKYRNITYNNTHFCLDCGAGLRQTDSFRLKATPDWGARHFMMLNWVGDELFADDIAKEAMQSSSLSGFHFIPVLSKDGTCELNGINQLLIEKEAAPGLIVNGRDIDSVSHCHACGRIKYHPSGIGPHCFNADAFSNMPDIFHSNEYFGWGHGADRLIIIKRSVYCLIKDNNLDRNLVFEPIITT